MRASRLCISLICTTPVKPASRSPSSRIAARIGLSSTMTIFGESALIGHSHPDGTHSTSHDAAKPCNYEQLGLVRSFEGTIDRTAELVMGTSSSSVFARQLKSHLPF